MSLRTFVDSAGLEWQAFDVIPRQSERRRYDRRSGMSPLPEEDGAERREEDRRVTVGRQARIAGSGWLCFEHAGDRRRLTPIPGDWERCSDDELEAYCRAARAVRATSTSQANGLKTEAPRINPRR